VRNPVLFLILSLLLAASGCIQTTVPVVKADIKIELIDGTPVITAINLTPSEVNILRAPAGTDVGFPSVNGQMIINFENVGYWAATPYRGAGNYLLTLGFRRDRLPEDLDHIKVVITVNDADGNTIARGQQMLIWGYNEDE